MTAKGKINASKVQAGDRILVQQSAVTKGVVQITHRKTGEGVHVARVVFKEFVPAGRNQARGTYTIHTTSGISPGHEPVQTMWLAPEDAAGIKRAHVEAMAEQAERWKAGLDEIWDEALAEDTERTRHEDSKRYARELASHVARRSGRTDLDNLPDPDGSNTLPIPPEFFKVKTTPDNPLQPTAGSGSAQCTEHGPLCPHPAKCTLAPPATKDHTGSTVVRLLEKVWARIRAEHPELPEVVIITGSGLVGASKWGHFRAEGWKVQASPVFPDMRKHELFLAGEALAKGARQVLQTMLHEAAHTLAKVRGQQDTSRQGRWHNATFRKVAEELGLEHKGSQAHKSHGFSFVTLTTDTADRYADLLAELDAEIRLVCHLPVWMGGEADEEEGGEKITGKPQGEGGTKSGPMKATCLCEEPVIIRLSQKVMDMGVVRCDDCRSLFLNRS